MTTKSMMLGTATAVSLAMLALAPVAAKTTGTDHTAAIEACSAVNPSQPVTAIGAVDDGSGIGFSLVWLEDATGELWMCDADTQGNVYSYALVKDDLLEGAGGELIGLQPAADGGYDDYPQVIAEKICIAYLPEGGTVMSSRPDGLAEDPGFVIFVKDQAEALYLCNATGDAMVWAFEPIGDPLTFEDGKAVS